MKQLFSRASVHRLWSTSSGLPVNDPQQGAVPYERYRSLPLMDLVAPSPEALTRAVSAIESLRPHGRVHLHCALGLFRTAMIAAAWLLHTKQAASVAEAVAVVKRLRPGVVFPTEAIDALNHWQQINHAPT